MLNVGDKIYYLDYEDSHSSYTIVQIEEINNNEYIKDGSYYHVHSDSFPNGVGYYLVSAEQVDTNNIKDRYYSSPEKAHESYLRFKEWRNNKRCYVPTANG